MADETLERVTRILLDGAAKAYGEDKTWDDLTPRQKIEARAMLAVAIDEDIDAQKAAIAKPPKEPA